MSEVRIIFLGTPEFARHQLEALIQDEHYEVVGVVSQPDRPAGRKMKLKPSAVKEYAFQQGLEVITPESVKAQVVLEQIKKWKAEAAVVVAYGQILPQEFLDLFPRMVVNLHASLLPRWRGAAPIQRAIMEGDQTTGVCLQVMVKKLDAGDVIGERKIEITEEMDALQLHDELMKRGADLLHLEFMDYIRGNLAPQAQDESLVTYAAKIDKAEALIDWSLSSKEIYNRMKGLKMGPGSYTLVSGKKLKIHGAQPVEVKSSKAGEILDVTQDSLVVACGQGALEVIEVQPESKAKMPVAEFLKGYSVKKGDIWGE